MSRDLGRTVSTPHLGVGSARTLSADDSNPGTPMPLSTETVPGPAGCQHKHEAPAGAVDDDLPLFNRAQRLSKSTYLVQGSQWSGSYIANHLRISPTHRFFSSETRPIDDLYASKDAVHNSLECELKQRMHDINEEDGPAETVAAGTDPCSGRSKIFLWEDSGGQCTLSADPSMCAEACELPPRIEAFELPCYFSETPERILIVKRTFTDELTALATALSSWLQDEWGVSIFVESVAHKEMTSLGAKDLEIWKAPEEGSTCENRGQRPAIDLVISLGGDGTTLWISTLFPDVVPPVFGVTLGSLSYLNQFKKDEMLERLTPILACRPFRVQLRSRLFVALVDEDDVPKRASHCVNECVIDRGPLSTMASIDVYVNDRLFTNVSADGLILATPTGSTAYSMSAGGPMVHPNVPCVLFTPISPHSLSMRPLILPDTSTLRIRNPADTRNNLWVSLDGRARRELGRDESVLVSLSPFPFPLVCKSTYECGDAWLQALTDNLNWGMRVRQRRHDTEARCIERLTSRTIFDFPLPPNLREWLASRPTESRPGTKSQILGAIHRRTLAGPFTPDELFPQPALRASLTDKSVLPLKSLSDEDSPQVPLEKILEDPSRQPWSTTNSVQMMSSASDDCTSSLGATSVPVIKSANGVSWSQLLAGRNRQTPSELLPKHSRGHSVTTESADSSLDSQANLRSNTMPDKDESPGRRSLRGGVAHSRSNLSLHKHSNAHHSPFVQPIQKLRAAIAISPGQPRDPSNGASPHTMRTISNNTNN